MRESISTSSKLLTLGTLAALLCAGFLPQATASIATLNFTLDTTVQTEVIPPSVMPGPMPLPMPGHNIAKLSATNNNAAPYYLAADTTKIVVNITMAEGFLLNLLPNATSGYFSVGLNFDKAFTPAPVYSTAVMSFHDLEGTAPTYNGESYVFQDYIYFAVNASTINSLLSFTGITLEFEVNTIDTLVDLNARDVFLIYRDSNYTGGIDNAPTLIDITQVPEPSQVALLLVVAAAATCVLRRRSAARKG